MPAVHPNYIKSANLNLITIPLGIIGFFLSKTIVINIVTIITLVGTMVFIFGISYFIRQGNSTIKYILLVLFVFGIISGTPLWIAQFQKEPVVGVISMLQNLVETGALVLLFKIPKTVVNKKGPDESEPL